MKAYKLELILAHADYSELKSIKWIIEDACLRHDMASKIFLSAQVADADLDTVYDLIYEPDETKEYYGTLNWVDVDLPDDE